LLPRAARLQVYSVVWLYLTSQQYSASSWRAPLYRKFPQGEKVTWVTPPVCPVRSSTCVWLWASYRPTPPL
jgi:hypothetical protein